MRGRSSTPPVGCYSGSGFLLVISNSINHFSSSFKASSFLITKGFSLFIGSSSLCGRFSSFKAFFIKSSAKSSTSSLPWNSNNCAGDTSKTSANFNIQLEDGFLTPVSQRANVALDIPSIDANSSWVSPFLLLKSWIRLPILGSICSTPLHNTS